jgi:hypothetical protein
MCCCRQNGNSGIVCAEHGGRLMRCLGGRPACCLPVFLVRFGAGGSAPAVAPSASAAAPGPSPCPPAFVLPRGAALPRRTLPGFAAKWPAWAGARRPCPTARPAWPPARPPPLLGLPLPSPAWPPPMPGASAAGGGPGACPTGGGAGEEKSSPGGRRFCGVLRGKGGGVALELAVAGLGVPTAEALPDELLPADGSGGVALPGKPSPPRGDAPFEFASGDWVAAWAEAPPANALAFAALPWGDAF